VEVVVILVKVISGACRNCLPFIFAAYKQLLHISFHLIFSCNYSKNQDMTIENFKKLSLDQKLIEIKYHGELLGSYERPTEEGGLKIPGDIYAIYDFWVYVSEDEQTVVQARRNPLDKGE